MKDKATRTHLVKTEVFGGSVEKTRSAVAEATREMRWPTLGINARDHRVLWVEGADHFKVWYREDPRPKKSKVKK